MGLFQSNKFGKMLLEDLRAVLELVFIGYLGSTGGTHDHCSSFHFVEEVEEKGFTIALVTTPVVGGEKISSSPP